MVALPTFLSISEAARKYGLDEARLQALVDEGKIRAGVAMGEVVINEEEVRNEAIQEKGLSKEDLPEYKKHIHLKGNPIWISEAARRYNIPAPTLTRWVKAGYIKRLRVDGNKIIVDEADVAYCHEIHKKYGKQGRILFSSDGTPYKPKTSPLAV